MQQLLLLQSEGEMVHLLMEHPHLANRSTWHLFGYYLEDVLVKRG